MGRRNHTRAGVIILVSGALLLSFSNSAPRAASPAPEGASTCVGAHGVVAAGSILAARVGIDILQAGGNAFDAAIAVSMTMGVVEPFASGIGGGGFAVFYSAREKKTYMLDFREMAPVKARPDIFKQDEHGKVVGQASLHGYHAVAVPGTLRGMEALHRRFATMKWDRLLQPAIGFAADGAPITRHLRASYADAMLSFSLIPSRAFIEAVFSDDGLPREVGDTFKNPDLARTLEKVAQGGADVFYKGDIARAIVKEFEKPGADEWLTGEDLERYRVTWREPLRGRYRDFVIVTSAPPSSGGTTLLEILNILEGYDLKKMGHLSPEHIHTYVEAQRLAFADRNRYLADPEFAKMPIAGMISKAYARAQRARIVGDKDLGVVEPGNPSKYESGNTTSFSVADKLGNMITVSQTINYFFGAGVVPEGTGIMLNDEMADFVADPTSVNAPGPGKRPLSSITPTLLLKDGRPFATMGAPGATKIITAVATVITNMVDFGMDIAQAVDAPRVHNGNAKGTQLESRIPEGVIENLERRGHGIQKIGEFDRAMGSVQGIMYLPDGRMRGVGDRRRDAAAVGY